MKRPQHLWLIMVIVSMLVSGCGGGQPEAAAPGESAGAPNTGASGEGDSTRELLGATPFPTPIPATPTSTPLPPPPSPTPRPSPTPAADAAAESTAQVFKPLTEMVEIPAGPFTMGRDGGPADEGPAHEVELPSFYVDLFEVTNAQFVAFVQDSGYVTDAEKSSSASWRNFLNGRDNHPVVKVSWNDAAAYCEWAGRRLPTEAEWEKAARGPEGFLYPWGNEWDPQRANVKESGFRGTTSAGSFTEGASSYGVFDMAGNVWEWTADWYQPYPGNAEPDEFYGEEFKVLRGGGWFDEQDQVLSTNRSSTSPEAANDDIGFRCASDG